MNIVDILKEKGDWMPAEELAEKLFPEKDARKSHTNSRITTRNVVMEFNKSSNPHIVIANRYKGYKLASNREEALWYIHKEKRTALRMLKKYYTMLAKVNNDGQLHLDEDNELDEIKTYIRKEIKHE